MWTAGDRSDLQSVIDFLGTPLIVDVLLAVHDGQSPNRCPDLSRHGKAVETAVAVLTSRGVVSAARADEQTAAEPSLELTAKGRSVSILIKKLVDFDTFRTVR